jgi:outer membrane protein assembly factor BamD
MTFRHRFLALLRSVIVGTLLAGCGGTLHEQTGGIADYERGKRAYDQQNWADAALDLKAFVEAYPGTERTDDALFHLGDAYFRMGDHALASGQFDRLLRDFPASIYEADARFLLARCDDLQSHGAMLDQTETERAMGRYREFLGAHPDHPRAAEAQARLAALRDRLAEKRFKNGRLYVRQRQYAAADRYLQSVIADFPESKWAASAGLLLTETLLRRERREDAVATLRGIPPGVAEAETQRKIDELRRELEGAGAP